MPEDYREYRRRRTTLSKATKKQFRFIKKLGYQTVISLILLITVCTLKFSFKENIINSYIQSAVLYRPDTSGFTDMLGNIINLYTEEGINNEETEVPENL